MSRPPLLMEEGNVDGNRVILANRMVRRRLTFWIAAVFWYFFLLSLPLQAAPQATFSVPLPLFSDFDGDHQIDRAELFSNGAQKSIHVSLGKFSWKSLSFDSGVPDRGRLVSDDIDSDGDQDL